MPNDNSELYEKICSMILNGEVRPGEKISETRLAQELGVSRTPVREVLRLLDRQGLITIYPKRFLKVSEYSREDLVQLGMMRISIDTLALRLAGYYANNAELLELKKTADLIVDARRANDAHLHAQYDALFHLSLAKLSRNRFLIRYMEEHSLLIRFIIMTHEGYGELPGEEKLYEHHAIVDALLNRDTQQAILILKRHLTDFYHLEDVYPDLLQ